MPDTATRADAIDVQEIMEQIRARIREKRGSDDPEREVQELAGARLAVLLDPGGARSELVARLRAAKPVYASQELPNYTFEDYTLFESHRGPLRFIRKLLNPLLKLFFNPNPLIQALNIQSRLNAIAAEREATKDRLREAFDEVQYEALHNLIVENTRLGAEVKNLTMKVESLSSRLEFNEKRARAIEGAIVYKPTPEDRVEPAREARREEPMPPREPREMRETREPVAAPASSAPQPAPPASGASAPQGDGSGSRGRRRRRRRGRRGGQAGPVSPGGPGDAGNLPGVTAAHTADTQAPSVDAMDDSGPDGDGDWEAGDSNEGPADNATPPDRTDSDPSDQGQ